MTRRSPGSLRPPATPPAWQDQAQQAKDTIQQQTTPARHGGPGTTAADEWR